MAARQYLAPDRRASGLGRSAQMLAAACLASLVLWAGFGAAIARFLGHPRARTAFNGAMAGLLVLSLVPVFW